MLARQLPGVSVLACADRYLAGRLAEHHLDATVHVLDDGFQHLQLERDLDLVIVGREDVGAAGDAAGRPAARAARRRRGRGCAPDRRFGRVRSRSRARTCRSSSCGAHGDVRGAAGGRRGPAPGLAVAGIASPGAVLRRSRGRGLERSRRRWSSAIIIRTRPATSARIVDRARAGLRRAGVVTTEKDFVRLLPFRPFAVPVVFVPHHDASPNPPTASGSWLRGVAARPTRGMRPLADRGAVAAAPHRIWRGGIGGAAGAAAADGGGARRRHAARPRVLPLRSARTGGWRCATCRRRFRCGRKRSARPSRAACSRTSAGC